jgi:6-phosphogluconolactonase
MSYTLILTSSDTEFVEKSADLLEQKITAAIAERGECIIGLSGGSTPRPIYQNLSTRKIDWLKVKLFLMDERYTDPGDKESNQRLVRETILANAAVPEDHCVFPLTSLPIEKCVTEYTQHLKRLFTDHLPDIVTLGLGPDGHIASLFPPLADEILMTERLVFHTQTDRFSVRDRISVSLNLIQAANMQIFFLKGADKKQTWEEMLASAEDERRWPAKRLLSPGNDVKVVALW